MYVWIDCVFHNIIILQLQIQQKPAWTLKSIQMNWNELKWIEMLSTILFSLMSLL